jgi:hypothetical protein
MSHNFENIKNKEVLIKIVNEIINKVIIPYQGSLLIGLEFKCINAKYVLKYTLFSDFNSEHVLKDCCLTTTEKLLLWFDFTDIIDNFDIEINTPNYTFSDSYFNLMKIEVGRERGFMTHPRFEKYQKYQNRCKLEKKEYEIEVPDSFINDYLFKKDKKKTFFGKLKKFLVSLWSKK